MVAYTTRHQLPYSTPSDPLSTVDNTLQALAESLDQKLDIRRNPVTGLKYARNIVSYEESAANLAGWIFIQTNMVMGYHMMRYDVRGYTYQPYNNIIDLSITCYDFVPDNTFYNFEVNNRGTMNFQEIRLLTRVSDGKLAIALLPDTTSNFWQYPKLVVDGYFGHTEATLAEMTGWTMFRSNSFTAYNTKRQITQQHWTLITPMGGGWVNYGDAWQAARYRKEGNEVFLQGLVKNGGLGTLFFTLPEGCRPGGGNLIFATQTDLGVGRTDVNPSGQIVIQNGGTAYHSLSGIRFPAER